MRRLVAYELVSLDGVAEDPDAFMLEWDQDMDDNLGRVIGTQDTVLLGRRTYEEWARFWPGQDIQPFSDFINPVEKFVATSTALEPDWQNATAIVGRVGEFVSDLKAGEGGDIGLHGSIALTRSLLAAGLVDELRVVVFPAIQIAGRKLFDGAVAARLTLIRAETSSSGCQLVDYRVER